MNENQTEAVPQDQNSGATQDQVEVRKEIHSKNIDAPSFGNKEV